LFFKLFATHKIFSDIEVCEVFILLENIELFCLFYLSFLLFNFLLTLHRLFIEFVFDLLLLFLLDQVFEDTSLTEDMPLIARHRLDNFLMTNCAHIERFEGVLPHSLFERPVQAFEHLPLAIGEDIGAGIVL
jgi:hypothetical protein